MQQWNKYCRWKERFGRHRQELAHNDPNTMDRQNDITRDLVGMATRQYCVIMIWDNRLGDINKRYDNYKEHKILNTGQKTAFCRRHWKRLTRLYVMATPITAIRSISVEYSTSPACYASDMSLVNKKSPNIEKQTLNTTRILHCMHGDRIGNNTNASHCQKYPR